MQPDVVLVCRFQGQLVVLAIVPPHQNPCAVRSGKLHRRQRFRRLALSPQQPEIALFCQFRPQLFQIIFRFRTAQSVQHAVQIRQFFPALGDLLRENFLRRAGFLIRLIVLLGVLGRCQASVQCNVYRRAVRLVEVLQNRLCIALVQPVEVGGDQIRFPAVCILFPAGFQFFRLGNDSPLDSLRCVEQQVKRRIRPAEHRQRA